MSSVDFIKMCHKLICHPKIIAVLAVNLMTIHAIKAVCCDYDGLCVDYGVNLARGLFLHFLVYIIYIMQSRIKNKIAPPRPDLGPLW